MQTNDIRQKYLEFFRGKKHVVVPSSPLVPENDPSTLFTGSGMQPMVPYLLGEKHPSGTRVTNSQKCFRSQDIEEVGDNRHTTFFEMLGNWSFGDYFKTEQVEWMWEFLTTELKLDPNRLYFSCFRGNEAIHVPRDTESAERWQSLFKSVGIEAKIGEDSEKNGIQPGERIFYYSEKKNWWSRAGMPDNMPGGEPGGGDTEMFWDFDPTIEKKMHESSAWKDEPCHVNCDCGRFMEIGNNVFMEYKKTEAGFERLASPNVDFGGGLERMAAALNDDPDVFKLDLFAEAKTTLETLSGKSYGESAETTHAFRVILDHIRAAVFLIGDGVLPDKEDREYFVRRLVRRSVFYGQKKLGISTSFAAIVAEKFINTYGKVYSNLSQEAEGILSAIKEEENKFSKTLESGFKRLNQKLSEGGNSISIEDLSFFHQTHGFPTELTKEIVKERAGKIYAEMSGAIRGSSKMSANLTVLSDDEINAAIAKKFKEHQDLSRTASAGKFKGGLADHSAKVTALHTSTHLMLAGLRKELGPDIHQAGSNITEERTRFDFTYPEKVPREVLDRVETYVNTAIQAGATVGTKVMEKEAAKADGVEGSFWEKYPEKVTVYQVEGPDGTIYSAELCGGPHVAKTAEIAAFGRFRITKEEASSAGVRRVKAVLE